MKEYEEIWEATEDGIECSLTRAVFVEEEWELSVVEGSFSRNTPVTIKLNKESLQALLNAITNELGE